MAKTPLEEARFQLFVEPLDEGYRIRLKEFGSGETGKQRSKTSRATSTCSGFTLKVLHGAIIRTLEQNGYTITDLKRTRKAPFNLQEADGIRLDLLFRSLNGLSKRSRMEDILHTINHMSREEAYYWHAKATTNNGTLKANGLKALRILCAGE